MWRIPFDMIWCMFISCSNIVAWGEADYIRATVLFSQRVRQCVSLEPWSWSYIVVSPTVARTTLNRLFSSPLLWVFIPETLSFPCRWLIHNLKQNYSLFFSSLAAQGSLFPSPGSLLAVYVSVGDIAHSAPNQYSKDCCCCCKQHCWNTRKREFNLPWRRQK